MTITIEQTLAEQAVARRAEELAKERRQVGIVHHGDGSLTVVHQQEFDTEDSNPRTFDGNVAHLVNEHRDYIAMDDADADIAEARERWSDGYVLPDQFDYQLYGQRHVKSRTREDMVKRYVAMFRPDVAHYEDRWEVTGYSQGDWQYGWGYVLTEDMAREGVTSSAEDAFKSELDSYGQYFRGDVYIATNLTLGDPVVVYGEQGAYVNDYLVEEFWVGGFLGMTPTEIAGELTSSPVTEEV